MVDKVKGGYGEVTVFYTELEVWDGILDLMDSRTAFMKIAFLRM